MTHALSDGEEGKIGVGFAHLVILAGGLISKSAMASPVKGWCFTINNPTGNDEWEIEALKTQCEYLVVGRERGEEGTPHLQGFVILETKKSLRQMKQILTRAHLESRRGTVKQASDYCKKDGDFTEYGNLPITAAEKTKEMWKTVIRLAETGQMEELKEAYPAIYLRYLEKLRSLSRPQLTILPELTNEWWYGPTGTGKSRKL